MAQKFETDVDGAIEPIQHGIERNSLARDGGLVDEICCALCQRGESVLRGREYASQVLAFGAVNLQIEKSADTARPAVIGKQFTTRGEVRQRRCMGRRLPWRACLP